MALLSRINPLTKNLLKSRSKFFPNPDLSVHEEDLFVDITYIGTEENPINKVKFFDKYGRVDNLKNTSKFLPQVFEENYVRVWSRDNKKRKFCGMFSYIMPTPTSKPSFHAQIQSN